MSYFKPKSLTWWSGLVSILLGLFMMANQSYQLGEVAKVIVALLGGGEASPSGMIILGSGLIGIRAKMERLQSGLQ